MLGGAFAFMWLVAAWSSFGGSAVVFDRHGQVVSAVIVDGNGRRQDLHALPGGLFHATPRLEGTIELECRGGARVQWGYVTRNMRTRLEIAPGAGCGRIVERP